MISPGYAYDLRVNEVVGLKVADLLENGKDFVIKLRSWLGSQVVRQGSAKPLHAGSIPARAST